jgi:thymidylate synthase (FAD)
MPTLSLLRCTSNVLSGGFVRLIDCMPRVTQKTPLACDQAIVNSVGVPYSYKLADSKSLIDALVKNRRDAALGMITLKFHVKAPIFVQREWSKEGSLLPLGCNDDNPQFYRPPTNNLNDTNEIVDYYMDICKTQHEVYKRLLAKGVTNNDAIGALPMNLYTEFLWSINLKSLMTFIERPTPTTKIYTRELLTIAKIVCPLTVDAYERYHLRY